MFKFFKKEKPKDLHDVINSLEEIKKDLAEVSKEIEQWKKEKKFLFQKIGFLRYNPFSEMGGNQSFSIALLDGQDSGIVITSLYTREGNRVYGKLIENGNSKYSLSKEEKEVIKLAKSQNGKIKSKLNQKTTSGGNFRPH